MVPTADRQKATVLVRIAFEGLDPRILPDMGVKVTFLKEEEEAAAPAARPATLLPRAAVQSDATNSFVYVLTGDMVDRRAVKVGGADGDRVEVLGGLRAGDRVVVSPLQSLTSGAKVVVK
jgi:HlyD family secretion protein